MLLTKTGLLIVLALVAMLVAGCGGAKYENARSVVSEVDGHRITDCIEQGNEHLAVLMGANSGVTCKVDWEISMEIYTYDGEAKEVCATNNRCNEFAHERSSQVGYSGNAVIILFDPPNDNLLKTLIAGFED